MLSAVISSVHSYRAMPTGETTRTPEVRSLRSSRTRSNPLKIPAPTADRDQTVSRRFKPSSRTSLNGEQPYPWDRLQPQDEMSRHRGAKHRRRYELLGGISLLSPEYLLSVERWPFHTEPPDHYVLLSHLLDLSVSQLSTLLPLHFSGTMSDRTLAYLRTPPLHFGRRPPQSNCLPCTVPDSRFRAKVRTSNKPGWYFKDGSTETSVPVSKPPTYPTQIGSKSNAKLQ
jgi:hypothetical protein